MYASQGRAHPLRVGCERGRPSIPSITPQGTDALTDATTRLLVRFLLSSGRGKNSHVGRRRGDTITAFTHHDIRRSDPPLHSPTHRRSVPPGLLKPAIFNPSCTPSGPLLIPPPPSPSFDRDSFEMSLICGPPSVIPPPSPSPPSPPPPLRFSRVSESQPAPRSTCPLGLTGPAPPGGPGVPA